MNRSLAIAALAVLLAAAPAAAETVPGASPPSSASVERGYIAAGGAVSLDYLANAGLALEGGVKLPAVPLWVRGSVAAGKSADIFDNGDFRRGAIGLEARRCANRVLCGFVGFDAGYQTQHITGDRASWQHRGAILAERLGVDIGGPRLRFRIAAEYSQFDRSTDMTSPGMETVSSHRWLPGYGLSAMLGMRL